MRANYLRISGRAAHVNRRFRASLLEPDTFRVEAKLHAFSRQNLMDLFGDVVVLFVQKTRLSLDHRHTGAEATKHLGELESDVTASHYDQMLGQLFEVKDGFTRKIGKILGPGKRWNVRALPDVDKN